MPEAEVQTLRDMRARRDEVERLLRGNGWRLTGTIGNEHYWHREGCDDLCTPAGRPELDIAAKWASLLDQAAAIAVKPIDPVPSPAPKESGGYLACVAPGCGDEDVSDLDQTTGLCGMCARQKARESRESDYEDAYEPVWEPLPAQHPNFRCSVVPIVPTPEAVEEFLMAPKVQAPHDAARDWASLSGRWGHQHSAPLPEGLAGLGARGQEPIAPGPTLAEVQEQLAAVTAERDRWKAGAQAMAGVGLEWLGNAGGIAEQLVVVQAERNQERAEAKAEIDRLTAALDCERQRANEEAAEAARARGIVQSLSETITAITAALDADPERSPAYDDNDQPIPLPRRVEIALMPEGIGHSRGERRAHELEVKLGNIEAMDYPGQLREACAELHAFQRMCHLLGATATDAREMLMQVLPLPRVVALLEVEAAEADTVVKRIRCRNPDMTSGEEPLSAAMDREQEARERLRVARDRLDHVPAAQNPTPPAWSLEDGLWLLRIAGIWLAEYKPGDYLLISGSGRFPAETNDLQGVLRRRGLPLLPAEALGGVVVADHLPEGGKKVQE